MRLLHQQGLYKISLFDNFSTCYQFIEIAAILAHDDKQAYFDVIHYQMPP